MMKWIYPVLVAAILAGCATGDDPAKPEAAVAAPAMPADKIPALVEALDKLPTEEQWWLMFKDSTLTNYEMQALGANHDLARAMARVEEARSVARLAGVEQKPIISANASASRSRSSESVQRMPANPNTSRFRATVDVAYEVDVWGRVKHSITAARADARQTEADLAAVRLALTSEVANAYFAMVGSFNERIVLTRTQMKRQDTISVLESRVNAGLSNALDLTRARAELSSLDAEMENLRRVHDLASHSLAILIGRRPEPLLAYASFTSAQDWSIDLPADLPSDVMKRRPDLVSAELAWEAAAARIGMAKAAFYPSFRLTASAGQESADLRDLLDFQSRIYSLGAGLAAPLFDAGKNQANLDVARARARQVAESYEQKLLVAFREFADANTNFQGYSRQAKAIEQTRAASADVVKLSRERYERGLVNFLEVIDGERTELAAERTLCQLGTQRKLALVAVIRALGGGWGG
ncbi:MAG: efflux transporter outer membrane subunit [Verrucomicrobiota bacterium]|nr:efflux transporter outer membrane subunit [Verrucomicrobiota bacterium]